MSVRLNAAFLAELVAEGYVPDETAARKQERRRRTTRSSRAGRRLFGSRAFTPPPRSARGAPPGPITTPASSPLPASTPTPAAAPTGTTILMRLRLARGTQAQIPFRVAHTFLAGVSEVRSSHTGVLHGLRIAKARGNNNTTKVEIPESRGFSDVFARFEKTPSGVVYEVYDSGTAKGKQIEHALRAGMKNGSTQTSVSTISKATWWREI